MRQSLSLLNHKQAGKSGDIGNMNQMQQMKFDISSLIMPQMAKAAGMTLGEYQSVYDSEAHEEMLENIMSVIKGSPIETRLRIGQPVWHDQSGDSGIIKAIDLNRSDGYFYLVEFTIDFGVKREDWYRGHVLKASWNDA